MASVLEGKCWMSDSALQRGRGFRKVFFFCWSFCTWLHAIVFHSRNLVRCVLSTAETR